LQHHVRSWEEITEDTWVRQVVTHGYYPHFQFTPPLQSPPPFWITPRQTEQVQHEVDLLLKKGAVQKTTDPLTPGFYSPLFVVPKKTGGSRLIFNLKNLNKFVVTHRFKMETLRSVKECLRPGEYTVSVDLEDAYLHVPLHPDCYHLFRFCLNGVVYHFTALPFGLASAPWAFTKSLRPVVAFLHTHSILVHAYLDDWLIRNLSIVHVHKDLTFFSRPDEKVGPGSQFAKIPPDP